MSPTSRGVFVALALGASFIYSQPAAAQHESPESSPLQVTAEFSANLGSRCKAGEGIIVQFQYNGVQPLRGYLVKLASKSATRNISPQLMINEVRNAANPIEAGSQWTQVRCVIPKMAERESAPVAAEVDALKFDDGSTWGPKSLRESHELIGIIDGMDFIGRSTELKKFVTPMLPERGPAPEQYLQTQIVGPLKITSGVWRDDDGQNMLAMEITNVSSTPIRGYLLTTAFFDPATGSRIRRASTKELETQGDPSNYLAPGLSWVAAPRKFSYSQDGSLASYTITVDLVAFADGSTFGPIRSQESYEVLGMFRGIDRANRSSNTGEDVDSLPLWSH